MGRTWSHDTKNENKIFSSYIYLRKISLIYFEIGKEGEKETEKYAYFLFVCFAKKKINMEKNNSFKKKIYNL